MQLNYKKTFFIGFAFLLISLFWQAYDTIVPRILVDKFGMNQTLSGAVMAFDNILALFMLPLFGHISDRTKTRIGKRTPYIIVGTLLASVFFVATTFADNVQLSKLSGITENEFLYSSNILDEESLRIDGVQIKEYMDSKGITEANFVNMSPDDENYFLVTAARNAYAWKKTLADPVPIIMFVALLFFVLLSMSVFRSPAVALMPDVTLKPLRSKANAVINLMGAAGGLFAIVVGIIFGTDKTSYMSYTWYFVAIAGLMLLFLAIFLLKVNEPKLLEEVEEEKRRYGLTDEEEEKDEASGEKLRGGKLRSLLFLLASVFLWFTAYNAVTSKFSVYAGNVLNMGYNKPLLIAQGIAIVSFIPIGIVASKIGRKKSILAGIILIAAAFLGAFFVTPSSTGFMYPIFIIAGLGWASINVNSYPMVVEMSKGSDVGRYTGFYYTASMAAQIITPILSGFIMDLTSMRMLFPYATFFSILALITMLFVMHGDNKPQASVGIEIYDSE